VALSRRSLTDGNVFLKLEASRIFFRFISLKNIKNTLFQHGLDKQPKVNCCKHQNLKITNIVTLMSICVAFQSTPESSTLAHCEKESDLDPKSQQSSQDFLSQRNTLPKVQQSSLQTFPSVDLENLETPGSDLFSY
jgi:hypothetical protein